MYYQELYQREDRYIYTTYIYSYIHILHRVEMYGKSSWAFVHHNLWRNWEIAARKLRKKEKKFLDLKYIWIVGYAKIFHFLLSNRLRNHVISSLHSEFILIIKILDYVMGMQKIFISYSQSSKKWSYFSLTLSVYSNYQNSWSKHIFWISIKVIYRRI